MANSDNLLTMTFETQHDWEAWLGAHHVKARGIWLKIARKDTGITSVSYADALESALCFGWIDGQKAASDNGYWLQKFTPRRPRSLWSRVNCEKATALIAAGRMRPAGIQQVEAAKRDGRWESAYASQRTMQVPDDFQDALNETPKAREFFGTLDSANRYAILWRLHTAKKSETRAARMRALIEMLSNGEKIHP